MLGDTSGKKPIPRLPGRQAASTVVGLAMDRRVSSSVKLQQVAEGAQVLLTSAIASVIGTTA
jgi:hypothetical protein